MLDLGKISVPDAILNKAGKLTDEEYAVIRTHLEVGNRLLADHPLAGLSRFTEIQHPVRFRAECYHPKEQVLELVLDRKAKPTPM